MFGFGKKKKKKKKIVLQTIKSYKPQEDIKEVEPKKQNRKMSYHVTPHPISGWQIKKGNADRALKRFKTQKEAIEFAKELESKGSSYVIHKKDGTTRKKKY